MPTFKNHTVVSIARDLKAFLNLEAGITRSGVSDTRQGQNDSARLREQLDRARQQLKKEANGVRPENMIWIFGCESGRSGSTWLTTMFGDLPNYSLWHSPRVGNLFGHFYDEYKGDRVRKDNILGNQKETWLKPIRSFILEGASIRYPRLGLNERRYLMIRDLHGSIGAPLIMEALPESRMILLIRDPRDVIASLLEANKKGNWIYEASKKQGIEDVSADEDPTAFVRKRSERDLRSFSNARRAYEEHKGSKIIIKYEDLRADTLDTLRHLHSTLGLTMREDELIRVVKKHSWENIPADQKGEGKFYRKATPGSWREDLTPRRKR